MTPFVVMRVSAEWEWQHRGFPACMKVRSYSARAGKLTLVALDRVVEIERPRVEREC